MSSAPTLFFESGFFSDPELIAFAQTCIPASPRDSPDSVHPVLRLWCAPPHLPIIWVLGIQTQVFILHTLLNHFPSALKTDFIVVAESGSPSMDLSSLEWELAM